MFPLIPPQIFTKSIYRFGGDFRGALKGNVSLKLAYIFHACGTKRSYTYLDKFTAKISGLLKYVRLFVKSPGMKGLTYS